MDSSIKLLLHTLFVLYGASSRFAGMDSVPHFNILPSQACSSGTPSVLRDITNLQEDDEDINMQSEFSVEAVEEYLKESGCNVGINDVSIPESETDGQISENGKVVPFLELDQDLVNEIQNSGISKSAAKLQWVRRRFDSWRVHRKIPMDKTIEQLDLKDFACMLESFMIQVVKLDGNLFPSELLQDLFRRFGCLIRREQERRIADTGVEEPIFNIKVSAVFKRARLACVSAMRRSRLTAGVCKKRKKVDEISFQNEQALLADVDHSISHSKGLQKRIMFYCVSRFGIRGKKELIGSKILDFIVGCENEKEFVEYNERLSKNYDVSMDKYQEESFRMPLRVYEQDVILTFKQFIRHYPIVDYDSNWLFKQPIISPQQPAWYNVKHRLSGRKISAMFKYMMQLIGVDGSFSNKMEGQH